MHYKQAVRDRVITRPRFNKTRYKRGFWCGVRLRVNSPAAVGGMFKAQLLLGDNKCPQLHAEEWGNRRNNSGRTRDLILVIMFWSLIRLMLISHPEKVNNKHGATRGAIVEQLGFF